MRHRPFRHVRRSRAINRRGDSAANRFRGESVRLPLGVVSSIRVAAAAVFRDAQRLWDPDTPDFHLLAAGAERRRNDLIVDVRRHRDLRRYFSDSVCSNNLRYRSIVVARSSESSIRHGNFDLGSTSLSSIRVAPPVCSNGIMGLSG
jgi:hypothetical protein